MVNDGSTDGTEKILQSYGSQIIVVTIPHTDRFVGRVFNAGIRAMSGQWFKELEADDRLFPWAIESMLSKVQDKEDTIYYADVDWINEQSKFFFGLRELDRNDYPKERFQAELFIHNIGNGISVLIHKSALEKHGLFDEDTMHEDYMMRLDWCIVQNCKMRFIDKVVAEYRVHKQSYTQQRSMEDLIQEDTRIKEIIISKLNESRQQSLAYNIAKSLYDPNQYPEFFTKPNLYNLIHRNSFKQIVYNVR